MIADKYIVFSNCHKFVNDKIFGNTLLVIDFVLYCKKIVRRMDMFTEKINRIFKVLKASSADIARFSKCDYSNISRISSGARIPKAGGKAAERLIDGIYFFADENGKMAELCDIIAWVGADSAGMVKAELRAGR